MHRFTIAAISCALTLATAPHALAQQYQLIDTYSAPSGAFDVMPDGRLIIASGNDILVQASLNSEEFNALGSVAPGFISAAFGASFLSVNPSGTRIALGDNDAGSGTQEVLLLDLADLITGSTSVPGVIASSNTSGAWSDDDTLFVSGASTFGAPGTLTRIDTLTSGATIVIDNLNGASGGVAIASGTLYTGNGFGSGTGFDATGAIAGFDLASLAGASGAVDFSTGTLSATALSAASLDFDSAGNLIVGGSNVFAGGEGGFVSVIDADALGDATSADGQRLFPDEGSFGFPTALYNDATGEILVRDGGVFYRYAVPSPGAGAFLLLGFGVRRRRRG